MRVHSATWPTTGIALLAAILVLSVMVSSVSVSSILALEKSTSPSMVAVKVPNGFVYKIIATGLGHPTGIAVDRYGNVYVATFGSPPLNFQENTVLDGRVIKINQTGAERIVVHKGTLANPYGLVFDKSGHLLISDASLNPVSKIFNRTSFRSVTPIASLPLPGSAEGIALDKNGNLLVSGGGAEKIFKITPTATVSTFASLPAFAEGLAIDHATNTTFVGISGNDLNAGTGSVIRINPDGTTSTIASGLQAPTGMAIGKGGHFGTDLYVANAGAGQILRVTGSGIVSVFASGFGQPNPNVQYDIYRPFALTFDNHGNMFGTDFVHGCVFEISPSTV